MSTLVQGAGLIATTMFLVGHGLVYGGEPPVPDAPSARPAAQPESAAKPSESAPAPLERPAAPRLLRGELVKTTDNAYYIKGAEGKEFVVHISKDTEFTGSFKSGDRIEVHLTPVVQMLDVMLSGNLLSEDQATSVLVQGEFVAVDGEFCVMKDSQAKEIRLHMSKDMKLPENLKAGDTIQAHVKTLNHAMFIKAEKQEAK